MARKADLSRCSGQVPQGAIQPSVLGGFHARRAGSMKSWASKCERWVGRSGGVNDREMALCSTAAESRHRGMQTEESVQVDHRFAGNIDRRPHRVISGFAVWDHDVKAVGGAALKDDYQPLVLALPGSTRQRRRA